MASVNYAFPITRSGAPVTGAAPTFASFTAFTVPGPGVAGTQPAISEIGGGWYGFAYDSEAHGEAVAVIDAGISFTGGERYTFMPLTKNAGRVLAGFDAQGRLNASALDVISTADVVADADGRSTFPKMLRAVYNRLYNRVQTTSTAQTVSNDAGVVVATMSVVDDGFVATKGKSS